jgi:hypothetical protein
MAPTVGRTASLGPAAWAALPDWTGQWVVVPHAQPLPAYNSEWMTKQRQEVEDTKDGKVSDPSKICGLPLGNPWMLGISDTHEWIVRPDGVWHNIENTGVTSRIYTDGRPHTSEDDIFPTYTGDSVGHWEGDTLVADTIALKGDTWLGPGALIHSDKLHLTQRIRKTAPNQLEVQLVAEDPLAFTKPWTVTYTYRRLPAGTRVLEYACKIIRPNG